MRELSPLLTQMKIKELWMSLARSLCLMPSSSPSNRADAVLPQTIANCYRKAGFGEEARANNVADGDAENGDPVALDDVPIPGNMSTEEFQEFIGMDDHLQTSGELSNEELLEVARENSAGCSTDQVDEVEPEEVRPLTSREKVLMMDLLRQFTQENGLHELLPVVSKIESVVYTQVANAKKQRTLESFFTQSKSPDILFHMITGIIH